MTRTRPIIKRLWREANMSLETVGCSLRATSPRSRMDLYVSKLASRTTTSGRRQVSFPLSTVSCSSFPCHVVYHSQPTSGQDPIIGGPPDSIQDSDFSVNLTQEGPVHLKVTAKDSKRYTIHGIAKAVNTSASAFEQEFFVTSRGGEWFFVPGINTLKEWAK